MVIDTSALVAILEQEADTEVPRLKSNP